MQPSDLVAAARDCEVAAKREQQRIRLAVSYQGTADSLRSRAAQAASPKDAAILIAAAEDLENKAQDIFHEIAAPSPATERLLLVAAGFFGMWACPTP